MIPNVFISSTIADLHYLRDAIREAVLELAYSPVMSEHGEVGYIQPNTAAEACYRSIKQCQLAVVIIGKRYGDPTPTGFGVTHNEFRTARENGIPTIGFVENEVLSFKRVYEANKDTAVQHKFPGMDQPEKTFALIEEITNSPSFNGLIPFTSSAEAKRIFKLQVADFVGNRLTEVFRPLKTDLQEVLTEIRTLRHEMASGEKGDTQAYLRTTRFLLNDRNVQYAKMLERLCGDIDAAMPLLISSATFDELNAKAGVQVQLIDDEAAYKATLQEKMKEGGMLSASEWLAGVALSFRKPPPKAWYCVLDGKKLILNMIAKSVFEAAHGRLRTELSRP